MLLRYIRGKDDTQAEADKAKAELRTAIERLEKASDKSAQLLEQFLTEISKKGET